MIERRSFEVPAESDMLALGARLAQTLRSGGVVYLSGELGVGKTTLARGILRGLGFQGRVKSPSYGLVETYELDGLIVHHLDFYRLRSPEETADLGIEDLLGENTLLLVEWPERGAGLPAADYSILITTERTARRVEVKPGNYRDFHKC